MADTVYALDAPAALGSEAALPDRADVLIVGGGLTGLSAAYHLTREGYRVVLCEADAIGNGASGRNGGQLHPGQRRDQMWLAERLGARMADALWRLGEEALALLHTLRTELRAPCDFRPGLIEAAHTAAAFDEMRRYSDHMSALYGVRYEVLERDALAAAIGSARYVGGVLDPKGGHMNPLALVGALANAAHVAGAHLFAGARVCGISAVRDAQRVTVRLGGAGGAAGTERTVRADNVLLAGNGYLGGLSPYLARRVVPLRNYILATEPLAEPLIPGGEAVADSRFVVRYFRQDGQGRMVFGGGETFGRGPRDVARFVKPYLAEVYPQLADAPVAAAWGGTLGITRLRMPIIRRLEPGLYAAAGFSGQGLGLSLYAGKVVADAIAGETSRLDVFSRLPAPPFPGGAAFKMPLAQLAMAAFAVRDRLGR